MLEKVIEKTTTEHKKLYDYQCKVVLSQPVFLARILKVLVKEVEDISEEELIRILKKTNMIIENDLTLLEEGEASSDVSFSIDLPNKKDCIWI